MDLLTAPLPGLYLGLLAFLLDRALRRCWDPVPARIWGAFALVLVILFGSSLFLGKVLLSVDIVPGIRTEEKLKLRSEGNSLQLDVPTQILPTMAQVRRQVKTGAWPMWNDLAGAGMPLLGDPQSQSLQPLVLATLPLSLPQASGVTACLRVLIALVFFFLLMRRQGLSDLAALFGSLAYGLGGFLLLWLNWPLANSAALFPLVLYALAVTADRGARRDFLLLIVALTSLLLAGHPETVLYVTIVGGLFALIRLFRREGRERLRLLGRWALAAGISLGLAAPALLPSAEFVSQTLRNRQMQTRNLRIGHHSPFHVWRIDAAREKALELTRQRFFPVFASNVWGNSRYHSYWGFGNTNEDCCGFVGGAALLAALLAFAPRKRRFPQERLFLGLAAASFVISIQVPSVSMLLRYLPMLNQSASDHRRMLLVLCLAVAWLGACTVERWRAGEDRPGRLAVTVCAALLIGIISWGYLSPPEPGMNDLLALRRFSMGLGIATVALAALIFFRQSPSSPGRSGGRLGEEGRGGEGLAWALAALVALELIVIHRPANPLMPRREFYPTTPVIEYLQKNAGRHRVAGLADRLLPNASAIYGLGDIRISNPFKPDMYAAALGPVSASADSTEHILAEQEHPIYQLLGARYLIGRVRYKAAEGQTSVFKEPGSRIFEREKVLDRLFLPASTEGPGKKEWVDWLAANPDFAARALVLPSPARPAPWRAARPRESFVEILTLQPSRISARTFLVEERLLASSVYKDSDGWRLLLDGKPWPVTVANGPFLAAWLPGGEHRVEMLYRAPGLLTGLVLAALAVAMGVVWLVPRPTRATPQPLPTSSS